MLKRLFDISSSLIALLLLLPVFILLIILISIDSSGGAFYRQLRVGKNAKLFKILKFRTMHKGSDKKGLLTVRGRDPRLTRIGYFLRQYKLDELPQLFNVLIGDMSIVGPRPEVPKYVEMYTQEQRQVLSVKPGLTDPASMCYLHENELLRESDNPEETYINEVMPKKLEISMEYINKRSFWYDMKLILRTISGILRS